MWRRLWLGVASVGLCAACGDDSGDKSGAAGSGGAAAGGGQGGAGAVGATGGSAAGGSSSGGNGAGGSATGGTSGNGALPEGDTGLAANYPGDNGLDADPAVLYADGFESYSKASDLDKNWNFVFQYSQIRFATESGNFHTGKQAIEFSVPQQNQELSNSVGKSVSPERDVLFLRYYSKFDSPYDVVGSSHNGSSISAHYFINGQATPGVPADGKNKFLANLENWRGEATTPSPGHLNVYLYHPLQRSQWGDHFFPDGTVLPNSSQPFDFGPTFVKRPDVIPELSKWYCYEFMVRANTPGQQDGRIAGWVDGKLVMDFPNLSLRDIAELKIDRFALDFHIGDNSKGVSKKWYDDVVAATSYIGPMKQP
ncbi:MAG: hypothetical protein R3B13_17995 [Polyangiaceae bacterium]